jgi:hypothetical protein
VTQSLMSNYPGGFANGVTVRGVAIAQTHPGRVLLGVEQHHWPACRPARRLGWQPWHLRLALCDIAGALLQCVANRGDIIFVKPGHTETVTSATGMSLEHRGRCHRRP